jgi:hypothetical protein
MSDAVVRQLHSYINADRVLVESGIAYLEVRWRVPGPGDPLPLADLSDHRRRAGTQRLSKSLLTKASVSQTHATSWVFGVLAAYVPSLLVILLHNVRSDGRPRNDR